MCFMKIWNLVKTTRILAQNSTVQLQKCGMLHDFACHPCAGAMLSSVTFQFQYMYCQKQAHLKRKTARFEQRRRQGGRVVNQKSVLSKSEHHKDIHAKQHSAATKMWSVSRFCVLSLHRGHANLLCIVPILVYVLPKQAHLKRKQQDLNKGEGVNQNVFY